MCSDPLNISPAERHAMRNRTVRVRLWGAGGVLTASAVAAAILFAVPGTSSPAQDQAVPEPPPATPVSVAVVEKRDIALWDEFSGRLEAIERVDVRARVAGEVQAVHFREGALVSAGRPADHDRSGALRGGGQAGRGAGRGGGGAAGARHERARAGAAGCGSGASSRSATSTSGSMRSGGPRPTCAPREAGLRRRGSTSDTPRCARRCPGGSAGSRSPSATWWRRARARRC